METNETSADAEKNADTPLFQIHDASVVRGGKTILHVSDFSLAEGEHVALLGPNGAGKSTFIQLLTREVFPLWREEPPVRFRGQERPQLADIKRTLGIVSSTMHDQVRVHLPVIDIVVGGLFGTLGVPLRGDVSDKDRALAKYYMGKQVASPLCNMRDGAAACLSVASYFFDDDGVLAGDTRIIKDGVLVGGLCDAVSAGRLGVAPTGNGRRESHKRKAYSRMTNTFFEGGTHSLGDMIASIKHGYMLFETNNGMEDPKNWAIQCTAEYGIEIVDGVLTDNYVAPVVMSGYVPDVLQSISMVSDGVEMEGAGMCGKGYKEWVRVSDGGPCLKARMKLG